MKAKRQTIILPLSSIIFVLLISTTVTTLAQNKKVNGKVVNVNKLEVIYDDRDEDYKSVTIDQPPSKDGEGTAGSVTVPLRQPADEDEEEELNQAGLMYRPEQMGEGVESEFDILYASMDYEVIHYASSAQLPDSVLIHLTDKSKNRKCCFPTPETSRLSSHFGGRRRRWHYGVDLAMPTGEPVFAAFDGIVRISKYNSSYGNLVVIRHFNGLETYYAHLSERDVNAGDTVSAGKVIGLCGNTGRSYGSHLHFEIRYMGKAMNPEYVFDCVNHKLLCDELVLTPLYFRKVGSSHSSPDLAQLHRVNRHAGSATNSKETVAASQPKSSATPARNMGATPQQSGARYYKVRSGDTLSKIAKRNGTTVRRLCQLNGIKETTVLRIGRNLRIR